MVYLARRAGIGKSEEAFGAPLRHIMRGPAFLDKAPVQARAREEAGQGARFPPRKQKVKQPAAGGWKVTSSGLEAGVPKNAITARVASIRSTNEVLYAGTRNLSTSRRAPMISVNTKLREIESASSQLAIPWKPCMRKFGVAAMARAGNLQRDLGCRAGKNGLNKTAQLADTSIGGLFSTQLDAPLVLADVIALVLEEDATYEETTGITPSLGAPCVTWFTASETFDHAVSTPVADLDSSVPAFCMDRELADLDAVWADLCIIPASETPQPLDEDVFESFKHDGDAQTGEIPHTRFATTASEHSETRPELLFGDPILEPTLPEVIGQVEHTPQLPISTDISPAINHPIIYKYPLRPIQVLGEGTNVDYGMSSCPQPSLTKLNSYTPGASPAPKETPDDLDRLSAISTAAPVPILPAQSLFAEPTHDEIDDAEMCESGTSGTLDVTMSSPDLVDIEMFPLAPVCLPLATLPSLMDVQMTLSVVDQFEVRENKSTGVEDQFRGKQELYMRMDGLR
ncbi:hypothetical protein CTheo_8343 [Ceratobasidium theobromae]|uniref:Uncharacterized protein n=1 Tax=Ceratobasidium theobromae TaxID=1582974 RepID=A0A5N5Q915_9AGAM|nr:hypothetical protein CTheo_8343 [Ceratobasidium theobromae]